MASRIKLIENEISTALRSLGFFNIEIETQEDERLSVTADGTLRNILLIVLVAKATTGQKKNRISEEIVTSTKQHAMSSHREPWSALVSFNSRKRKVDNITWADLSTH